MKSLALGIAVLAGFHVVALANATDPDGRMAFESLPAARFEFAGPVGGRVRANVENWLLQAPQANPGMLEMFRMRDRQPTPKLVPWAGEFIGKYLISAVQALRMSDDLRLRQQVADMVARFIATQADDGYLGPFPTNERLLGHWDLWGHYHAILALVLWHEQTGDPAALTAARKAADLVCRTYLDTGRRVFDAGDHEMNMSILTGLAMLHRLTGEPQYLRMAREVEKDWERAGDYLRAGLDGREFYRSPRPRWESLHDLQGLLELWRITGEARYRDAFEHHWRSIRRWDRRNTGGFSSGEQATGNPYAPTAIETCCTVAWTALTVDYLRLTGDSQAADDLELATLNGGLGAQHPSGRWWTYNTPMDGVREASAHTIVFQARAGTPELNCCSVNAPRVLGMLSDWAVMAAKDGLILNWLGSGSFAARLPQGDSVTIHSSGEAWRDGQTVLQVSTAARQDFTLRVRIPAWAREPQVKLNGAVVANVAPGHYLELSRNWSGTNRLDLDFKMPVRFVAGANEVAGKVSLYRGPLLLAFDQAQNDFDEVELPPISLERLAEARLLAQGATPASPEASLQPWLKVSVPAEGREVHLVDFASAGAHGTRYRSWLPVEAPPPAPAFTQIPPDAGRVPPGLAYFQWRGSRTGDTSYRLEISPTATFAPGAVWSTNVTSPHAAVSSEELSPLVKQPDAKLFWHVVSCRAGMETMADVPPAWFRFDPTAPPQTTPAQRKLGPNGEVIAHSLRGESPPEFGGLISAKFAARDATGTELNGRDQMLVYAVSPWPEEDFSVSLRVRINEKPQSRIGQVFSAWVAGMDDPLRLVVDGEKLFARVEAGGVHSTPGTPVHIGQWCALATVKRGGTLRFYVDGQPVGECVVPEFLSTQALDCALGGNPHFSGKEFLAARFAEFRLYARALSDAEVQALAALR